MARKIAVGVAAVVVVLVIAGGLWVRSVFARDTVRAALAAQISSAIGQPVSIGGISASIFPRVTVRLRDVTIGQPVRIQAETLRLGTDLGALLTRRIVHGAVNLDGATIQLPLPPLGSGSSTPGASGSPAEIVSIDAIMLNDVAIVSGGRTLRADIEVVPHGTGATLRKLSLSADDTRLEGSGEITDLAGPVGNITMRAGTLNLTRLLDFLTAFSSGSGMAQTSAPRAGGAPTNLELALTADRATMGSLALEKLGARARVTQAGVALDPVEFGVFGGSYKGAMTLASRGAASTFRLNAALNNLDVGAAMAFAGSPGTMSGRLAGRIDVSTPTTDPAKAIDAARGTARVEVRDGVVKNLGLVKTVVIATSMRADAPSPLRSGGSTDEPFTVLGATFAIANGGARTDDLHFESPDILLRAGGSVRLDGSAIDLKGNVQLSDPLSQQAGRDLFRYTQEQGRVTLPAAITGSVQSPSVHIDVAAAAGRAIGNKAQDELKKALGRIIKK